MLDLPGAPSFPAAQLRAPVTTHLDLDQKLGHVCEEALRLLLESDPNYKILVDHHQLRLDRHRTVGEVDFLLNRHSDNAFLHLELAVKFYLAVEQETGVLLPGPDARDNYYRKLKRLQTHQLLLAQRYPNLLPTELQEIRFQPTQLVHGCLFDHLAAPKQAIAPFLNPDCRRGKWIRKSELKAELPGASFELIPKPLWPVPYDQLPETLDEIEILASSNRCFLTRCSGIDQVLFVTPDSFPEQT